MVGFRGNRRCYLVTGNFGPESNSPGIDGGRGMVVVVVVVDDNDARCDTVFDRVGSPDFEATDAAKWLVHRKQPAWK